MKGSKSPKLPNYITKIRYLAKIGAIPLDVGAHMIDVAHDTWCGMFEGRRCDCNPDIRLRVTVPDASRN